jgi:hypothetical protein
MHIAKLWIIIVHDYVIFMNFKSFIFLKTQQKHQSQCFKNVFEYFMLIKSSPNYFKNSHIILRILSF